MWSPRFASARVDAEGFDPFMKLQELVGTAGVVAADALARIDMATASEIDRIGPAILVLHSQPGRPSWVVADRRPNLVKAMVELEPGGPPVASGPPLNPPTPLPYGLTTVPITYSPPVSNPPSELQFTQTPINDRYVASCLLQVEPARKLPNIAMVPILLLTSEAG